MYIHIHTHHVYVGLILTCKLNVEFNMGIFVQRILVSKLSESKFTRHFDTLFFYISHTRTVSLPKNNIALLRECEFNNSLIFENENFVMKYNCTCKINFLRKRRLYNSVDNSVNNSFMY